jgi:ABC-type sulfate transport system permease component
LTFGVLAAAVAASSPPSDDVTPGVLGFLVVAAIGVALVFLLRSMNKQFRKIAPKDEEAAVPGDAGPKPGPNATAAQEAPK